MRNMAGDPATVRIVDRGIRLRRGTPVHGAAPPLLDPVVAIERELPSLRIDLKLTADQTPLFDSFERQVRNTAEAGRVRNRHLSAFRVDEGSTVTADAVLGTIADDDTQRADATRLDARADECPLRRIDVRPAEAIRPTDHPVAARATRQLVVSARVHQAARRNRSPRRCSHPTKTMKTSDIAMSIVAAAVMVRLMLSLIPANIWRGSVR